MSLQRRAEILSAFASVLADHGYAGATIAAVAQEADMSPGLLHHYFKDKDEMLSSLLKTLVSQFRSRVRSKEQGGLAAYVDAALRLDDNSDLVAARSWVGIFAEGMRAPALFKQIRRVLETEILAIQRTSGDSLDKEGASAVLAYIVGALVFGAYAPKKTAGFAAPQLHLMLAALKCDAPGQK